MKIGFNVKKIYATISYIEYLMSGCSNSIQNHELRIQHIEDSEWVQLGPFSGNIEINQEFSEIKMLASVDGTQNIDYCFSCNYDSNIFHNSTTGNDEFFIVGNPIANNYGCKFKYTVAADGKQYLSVDSCYNGANTVDKVFEVWIKTIPTSTQ